MEFVVKEAAQKILEEEMQKAKLLRQKQVREQACRWSEEQRRRLAEEKEKQRKEVIKELTCQVHHAAKDQIEMMLTAHDLAVAEIGSAHRAALRLREEEKLHQMRAEKLAKQANDRGRQALKTVQHTQKKMHEKKTADVERRRKVREEEDRRTRESIARLASLGSSDPDVDIQEPNEAGPVAASATYTQLKSKPGKGPHHGVQSSRQGLRRPVRTTATLSLQEEDKYEKKSDPLAQQKHVRGREISKPVQHSPKRMDDKKSADNERRRKARRDDAGRVTGRSESSRARNSSPSPNVGRKGDIVGTLGRKTTNTRSRSRHERTPQHGTPSAKVLKEPVGDDNTDAWKQAKLVEENSEKVRQEKMQRQKELRQRASDRGKKALKVARLEQKVKQLTADLLEGTGQDIETALGSGHQISGLGLEGSAVEDNLLEMSDTGDISSEELENVSSSPSISENDFDQYVRKYMAGADADAEVPVNQKDFYQVANEFLNRLVESVESVPVPLSSTFRGVNAGKNGTRPIAASTRQTHPRSKTVKSPPRHSAPPAKTSKELVATESPVVSGQGKLVKDNSEKIRQEKTQRQKELRQRGSDKDKKSLKGTRTEQKGKQMTADLSEGTGQAIETALGSGHKISGLGLEGPAVEDNLLEMSNSDDVSSEEFEKLYPFPSISEGDFDQYVRKNIAGADADAAVPVAVNQKDFYQVANEFLNRLVESVESVPVSSSFVRDVKADDNNGKRPVAASTRQIDPKSRTVKASRHDMPSTQTSKELVGTKNTDAWKQEKLVEENSEKIRQEKMQRQKELRQRASDRGKKALKVARQDQNVKQLTADVLEGTGQDIETALGSGHQISGLGLEGPAIEDNLLEMSDTDDISSDEQKEETTGAESLVASEQAKLVEENSEKIRQEKMQRQKELRQRASDRGKKALKVARRDQNVKQLTADVLEGTGQDIETALGSGHQISGLGSEGSAIEDNNLLKMSDTDDVSSGGRKKDEYPFSSTPKGDLEKMNYRSMHDAAVGVNQKDLIFHEIVNGFLNRRMESIELLPVSSSSSSDIHVDSSFVIKTPLSHPASNLLLSPYFTEASTQTSNSRLDPNSSREVTSESGSTRSVLQFYLDTNEKLSECESTASHHCK